MPRDQRTVENEWPSDDVARMVHAFGDEGRKADVRKLAERVKSNEEELHALRESARNPTPSVSEEDPK